jgi:L-asparaginase
MKKICLLATGGTIASRPGPDGLVPALTGEKMIKMIPELRGLCQIDYKEILQLDSSNLQPEHWQFMARQIDVYYEKYDGFVISHGTDTMAYSAAAITYMLTNLEKPVVVTGAQLPIEAEGTDGKRNLLAAFSVAVSDHFGVYLVFADKIIHGTQARKMYTENLTAFWSINRPDAGRFTDKNIVVWDEMKKIKSMQPLKCQTGMDKRVCVLKIIPGFEPNLLRLTVDAGYAGIILEGFGAGGIPNNACERSLLPGLNYAQENGVVVVCTTQCVYDGVHLDRYEVGITAERMGVISGKDMTIEALVPKLMLSLLRGRDKEETKKMLWNNTYGEVE